MNWNCCDVSLDINGPAVELDFSEAKHWFLACEFTRTLNDAKCALRPSLPRIATSAHLAKRLVSQSHGSTKKINPAMLMTEIDHLHC